MNSVGLDQLPPSFRKFCAANDINGDIYQLQQQLPRYIRFKDLPTADIISDVERELEVSLQPVRWLPGFYALPQDVKIASSNFYKKGQIFGIDASSGAAVAALNCQPGDHVLDLCTAPGAKLCLIADQVKLSGTLTGVDISRPRLAATRTLVRKYGAAENCRLFLADGTTFDERPPTRHVPENGKQRPPSSQKAVDDVRSTEELRAREDESAQKCSEGGRLIEEAAVEEAPMEGAAESDYPSLKGNGRNGELQNGLVRSSEELCNFAANKEGFGARLAREGDHETKSTGREVALPMQDPSLLDRSQSGHMRGDSGECNGQKDLSEEPEGLEAQPLEGKGHVETLPFNQKTQRKRRKGSDADGGPQLFFYGRGITPPALEVPACLGKSRLYDKVLVDAECTHDGSLKHIQKYDQWGWDTFDRRVMNPQRLASITQLQGRLLRNGFRLLKEGGTLVYSTCSFTKAQNEAMVSAFLDEHSDAHLIAIPEASNWPCSPGGLPHTLRFDPIVSKTGGLFVAKISKRASPAYSKPLFECRIDIEQQASKHAAFIEGGCRWGENKVTQSVALEDLEAPLLCSEGEVVESTEDLSRPLWQVIYDEVL